MSIAERYERAMHAIRSGVATEHGRGSNDGSPKHLRMGVNSALINDAALVRLLIAKGLITEEEYSEAVVEEAEREVKRYEDRLTAALGSKVTLA